MTQEHDFKVFEHPELVREVVTRRSGKVELETSKQYYVKCSKCDERYPPKTEICNNQPPTAKPDSAFLLGSVDPRMKRSGARIGTSHQRFAQRHDVVDEIFGGKTI